MGDAGNQVKSQTSGTMGANGVSRQKPNNMNGPLYMQSARASNVVLVRRSRRKEDSGLKQFGQWMIENQIGLAFNLIALLFLAHHFIPKAEPFTTKFFTLAYYNAETGKYGHGVDDGYLLAFFVLFFTGVRASTMEYGLAPFAKSLGIRKTKPLTRFSEQGWMVVYYTVSWVLGLYIYFKSDYFFDLRGIWTHWPSREVDGLMKFYILAQSGIWVQQIVVLNIEERRKDHWQMLAHHFITCGLLFSCYTYGHTPVGHVILVVMDVTDIFLSLAKCLKYAGFTTICDVTFGVFMLSWVVFRHIFYNLVCWSIYKYTPEIMPTGCFKGANNSLEGPLPTPSGYRYLLEPFFDSEGLVCYNETVKWAFLTPLLILQGLTIAWFVLVIRVAVKVLSGANAEEVRSDDEGDEEEEEYIYEEPLETEVGVDEIDLKSWERRTGVKRGSSATSGVSLPGHSDRKELLGRIGCEKQVE